MKSEEIPWGELSLDDWSRLVNTRAIIRREQKNEVTGNTYISEFILRKAVIESTGIDGIKYILHDNNGNSYELNISTRLFLIEWYDDRKLIDGFVNSAKLHLTKYE